MAWCNSLTAHGSFGEKVGCHLAVVGICHFLREFSAAMTRATKGKVVHLTSVHTPADPRIVLKECGSLADAGYDVVVVAAGESKEVPQGVTLRSLPEPRGRRERLTKTVWQVYRAALHERAAVYHFHDPELMFVGLALRMRGARVIFDVHEDIPADISDKPWIPTWMRRPVAAAASVTLAALNRFYTAVVAATPTIAKRFRNTRTIVVANYPKIEEFASTSTAAFAQRPPHALYLGSVTIPRCIDLIMEALDRTELSNDVRLLLAGRFENDALEQRMRSLAGWNRVDFVGWRPRNEVPSLLESARLGLLLFRPAENHSDAMPTKLFEYMAAGLPVIISNTIRLGKELERAGCVVVVDPFDTAEIAKVIETLISEPERAQAMGALGKRLVQEKYQWAPEAAKLTRLYADIA